MAQTFLEKFYAGNETFRKYPTDILSPIEYPKNQFYGLLKSYCEAGVDVENTSQGLNGYFWYGFYNEETGIFTYYRLDRPEPKYTVDLGMNVFSVDFCFDQNMKIFISYEKDYKSYYYHFNAELSKFDEVSLGDFQRFPRCVFYLDLDKDPSSSDIILCYIQNNNFYFKVQRERFLTERLLIDFDKKYMLWKVGFSKDGRFLFQVR